MVAARTNITIEAGTDFAKSFVWANSSRVPFNLTGWTARASFKRKLADLLAIVEFTTANGALAIDGPAGKITWIIPETATRLLSDTYLFDFELIDPAGKVTRLLQGYATISPEVTT